MKIQKAKSFGLGPGHFIFIWDRTDRPILLLAGFPFLSGRGNIVSRAPRKYHNCWSARCDCLFFLLSISIFFASSTDKWNCCWCDFLLSVCAYSPFSCSRMGHWALVFSCWAARYTHVWTIARIPRVGSCCVRVELWKGKKLSTPARFRLANIFSLSFFLPILIITFPFSFLRITLCQLAASWTPYRMCVCQKTPAEMNIKNSRETGRALKWDDESISSFLIIAFMPSQTATATFFRHV